VVLLVLVVAVAGVSTRDRPAEAGMDTAAVAPTPSPGPPGATPEPAPTRKAKGVPTPPRVKWRRSRAVGLPYSGGRLVRGVQLPEWGRHHFTWDPIRRQVPNRGWRRWGTRTLVRTLLDVAKEHRTANPGAPRLAIGDLSRPRGGSFDARFGNLGHSSHQNGLDADIYYPRRDRAERGPSRPRQVDRELAQDLVDRFVAAGAEYVFVGPSLGLTGPPGVVQPLVHHDDHLHVRLPNPRAARGQARP
jgi:murein endopeptidase